MKTVSVRELKAHWSEIENQVRGGTSFLVLNRGKPAARIVPAAPREVLAWDDHLFTYRDWETDRKSTRLNSSH